jgi:hypothetical protein
MSSAADAKMKIGLPHFHFLEEHIGHARIVMLTGMDQYLPEMRRQRAGNRRGLDKLRTRAYNRANGLD